MGWNGVTSDAILAQGVTHIPSSHLLRDLSHRRRVAKWMSVVVPSSTDLEGTQELEEGGIFLITLLVLLVSIVCYVLPRKHTSIKEIKLPSGLTVSIGHGSHGSHKR